MGLGEHLWAELVAVLFYIGVSADDFLVVLCCQEMCNWYLLESKK